jgi:hypothetical protein
MASRSDRASRCLERSAAIALKKLNDTPQFIRLAKYVLKELRHPVP